MGQHFLFVLASLALFLAFLADGVAFFAPFWLGNIKVLDGPDNAQAICINEGSIYGPGDYKWRGLWAQCAGDCKWFFSNDNCLQANVFSARSWHLATQVLYFVGVFMVLFCEIFARVQLCCDPRVIVYRAIGFLLLTSFVIQAAALAVFGGFANRDYGASAFSSDTTVYLAWAYWMGVTGGCLTLLSGILFLLLDCVEDLEK